MRPTPQHRPSSILVTGGAGFIGSNYLLSSARAFPEVQFVNLDAVTYAGRPENLEALGDAGNYCFVEGDITNAELVKSVFERYQFSTVLHFAAESHVDRSIHDPLAFVRTNVMGTTTILDAARLAWKGADNVRFFHVSTDEVFGSLPSDGFFTEETAYEPRSPYAASKASADHLVRAYHETYGLPIVISNASNNYGPYQYPEKLIPLVIQNVVSEKPVPVYGKGDNIRDWLHVLDHCDAINLIMRSAPAGSTYVVGGGEERTNLELIETLIDHVDQALGRPRNASRRLIKFVTDRPGHDFRYALDGSRLRADLGWSPTRSLSDGLKETVNWYLENQAWLESAHDKAYDTYYRRQYVDR